MKLSRFYELVEDEFGSAFASVVLSDTKLTEFGDRVPAQLIRDGEDTREVWYSICRALEVPKERWQGKIQTKRHAE